MNECSEAYDNAINNTNHIEYRDKIDKLEKELHGLRDELQIVEKEKLQDEGYKPIVIEDATIMVPVGMTLNQLYMSLQQISPPANNGSVIKNLVSDEDIKSVRSSSEYKQIVEKRQDLIEEITQLYSDFWESEVKPNVESDEEKIVYMLAGLDRDIRSRKLEEITGVKRRVCESYHLQDGSVYKN